ncbi:MAG: T9SS type A sorting domain-containing protein [Bacteroides sp.]|nr:T9SS type A sorting domain-containing protein [Bacteroides sp.]
MSKVYPNPTYGTVHLELNNFADELKVMDITGKTLISKANPDKQESIDLSDYNSGIYIIQLKFGNDVLYNKVVKK